LRIGFPWVNTFNFNYQALGEISNIGFMGLSLGVDYLYLDRSFVSVSGAGIMDFLLPFPAPIDYGGIKDHSLSLYGSVSNNHLLIDKRFSVGYGLSFGNDVWNTINHDHWSEDAPQELVEQESVSRQSHSLGLVFPVYYYSKKNFYCGFVYRPMLLQFIEEARWTYQHTVSFDFGWQIRLNKR
jgi:hypothetical protein